MQCPGRVYHVNTSSGQQVVQYKEETEQVEAARQLQTYVVTYDQ
jgi:hypothetical protein